MLITKGSIVRKGSKIRFGATNPFTSPHHDSNLQIREQESSDINGGDELRSIYLYTINENNLEGKLGKL